MTRADQQSTGAPKRIDLSASGTIRMWSEQQDNQEEPAKWKEMENQEISPQDDARRSSGDDHRTKQRWWGTAKKEETIRDTGSAATRTNGPRRPQDKCRSHRSQKEVTETKSSEGRARRVILHRKDDAHGWKRRKRHLKWRTRNRQIHGSQTQAGENWKRRRKILNHEG